MPVNMDPSKRRRPGQPTDAKPGDADGDAKEFGKETELDREKDAADAEWKNLWDATEVIDMDKW